MKKSKDIHATYLKSQIKNYSISMHESEFKFNIRNILVWCHNMIGRRCYNFSTTGEIDFSTEESIEKGIWGCRSYVHDYETGRIITFWFLRQSDLIFFKLRWL